MLEIEDDFPETWDWPDFQISDDWANILYLGASFLQDPLCKGHECFRRLYVLSDWNVEASRIELLAKGILLSLGAVIGMSVGILTSVPAAAIRGIAARLQENPYLYTEGSASEIPVGESFKILNWNVCFTNAGHVITDGGVSPWPFRIDRISNRIKEMDPDVLCLYEIFDPKAANALFDRLEDRYAHFYFHMGPTTLGVSSGMFVASKHPLTDVAYYPFPKEIMSGRGAWSEKGAFFFDVGDVTLCSTHLQHSEEPERPTEADVLSRDQQMQFILEKMDPLKSNIFVMGDLNLDPEEMGRSSWKEHFTNCAEFGEPTWGGDHYCAGLVGREVSTERTLDYFLQKNGTVAKVKATLVETGFDARKFLDEADSDHLGILSEINS